MNKTTFLKLMDTTYRRVKWKVAVMSRVKGKLCWTRGSGWLIKKTTRKGKVYWKVCPGHYGCGTKLRREWMQNLKLVTSEQLGIADDTVA